MFYVFLCCFGFADLILKCEHCDQRFDNRSNFDRHQKLHAETKKSFICDHCGLEYYTLAALKEHTLAKHSNPNQKKMHECEVCQKQFVSRGLYKRHIVVHSEDRPFHCDQCSNAFKLKTHLVRHNKKVHSMQSANKPVKRIHGSESGEFHLIACILTLFQLNRQFVFDSA